METTLFIRDTGTSHPERMEVLAAAVQRVRILPAMVPVTPTITSSMVTVTSAEAAPAKIPGIA